MGLDPFDMLVRLGAITQAQLEAADRIESTAATTAARLVAVGVDAERLLKALSDLTRMAIAPPEVLAAAGPMSTLPPSIEATMRELIAVPIGRIDEGILDVAIADPRTSKRLTAAAIAHRPRLALEPDILEALGRVFPPDPEHAFSDPTANSVIPRPVTSEGGFAVPQPVSTLDESLVATGTTGTPRPVLVDDGADAPVPGLGDAPIASADAPTRLPLAAPPSWNLRAQSRADVEPPPLIIGSPVAATSDEITDPVVRRRRGAPAGAADNLPSSPIGGLRWGSKATRAAAAVLALSVVIGIAALATQGGREGMPDAGVPLDAGDSDAGVPVRDAAIAPPVAPVDAGVKPPTKLRKKQRARPAPGHSPRKKH